MYGTFDCISVCVPCVRASGTGGTDSYEPPRGWSELNPGPLKELSVLFTNEPSLQTQLMAVFRGGVTELPWGTYGHRSTHYREISSSAVSSCSISRNTCTCRPQRKRSLSSGNGVFQHYLWWTWGLGGFTLGSLYHNLWSEFNWDDCCAGRVSTCLASVPNHPVQLYLTRSTTAGGTLDLLAMTKPTMCQGDLTLNQISRGSKAAVCLYCTIWGLSSLTVKPLLNSKSYFYCFQL